MNPKGQSFTAIHGDADSKAEEERSTKRQAIETLTDRISELPDSLIVHILCLLDSTKEAVKTSSLSKRWRYLWRSVQSLNFSGNCPFCDERCGFNFVSFVNKTLTQCNSDVKLTSFKLQFYFKRIFQSDVDSWIVYAVRRYVPELSVDLGPPTMDADQFLLPEHVFVNSFFVKLRLVYCLFNPKGLIEWKMLKVLCISETRLTEDLIESILCGSPVLESFELADCYGFSRLDITSKSVKRLVFDGYSAGDDPRSNCDEVVEVNAPNVLSLDVKGTFFLLRLLLLDTSSLVVANLDGIRYGNWHITLHVTKEDMLAGLIESLEHAKELRVWDSCSKIVSRLEAKSFKFPENMKFPFGPSVLDYDSYSLEDEDMEDSSVDEEW